ncbi:1-phosphatidylinositol-4,5-bisphosphate phosphodiesterase epsilon-1 [Anopheles sinensis]|uniref:1-phosphatidylinositol-4,5-bisphosphate phosphodiesterase epsilon-1 n=1 Tax=Anopheles sinensis TaxID=74873 RepID=A0A084WJD7_ANOSI|nr:1-phosphatidylinositol-4,5-bisphosphate phosphodiesterase epsilon-1 [Anopheles sinensis]
MAPKKRHCVTSENRAGNGKLKCIFEGERCKEWPEIGVPVLASAATTGEKQLVGWRVSSASKNLPPFSSEIEQTASARLVSEPKECPDTGEK